jgi:hypothetical protein
MSNMETFLKDHDDFIKTYCELTNIDSLMLDNYENVTEKFAKLCECDNIITVLREHCI